MGADAALFFSNRIQASSGECPGRGADMSSYAAGAMRKVLPQIGNQAKAVKASNQEAAQMLMYNRERVVQDITNTSSVNIDAKTLTQKDLKRVDAKHLASVDAMVNEVCCCLLGRATMKKPSLEDALVVWPQAATFLAGRIQGTASECPGRKPNMSAAAATALRTALAQTVAAHLLMNNRERVVHDITNGASKNIDGKTLTQLDLKRVDAKHQASVDAMVREVCSRLLGNEASTLQQQHCVRRSNLWRRAIKSTGLRLFLIRICACSCGITQGVLGHWVAGRKALLDFQARSLASIFSSYWSLGGTKASQMLLRKRRVEVV